MPKLTNIALNLALSAAGVYVAAFFARRGWTRGG